MLQMVAKGPANCDYIIGTLVFIYWSACLEVVETKERVQWFGRKHGIERVIDMI